MSHEIFFPVPPTPNSVHAIARINKRSELTKMNKLEVDGECISIGGLALSKKYRSIALARVAYVDVAYCIYNIERRRINIERIVVIPSYRRQGIATDIVNAIAERYTPCTMQMTIDASNIEANEWARAVDFGATKFIRGCESSGDKVQLEFMEIRNIEK